MKIEVNTKFNIGDTIYTYRNVLPTDDYSDDPTGSNYRIIVPSKIPYKISSIKIRNFPTFDGTIYQSIIYNCNFKFVEEEMAFSTYEEVEKDYKIRIVKRDE